jgi:hypothetical protein
MQAFMSGAPLPKNRIHVEIEFDPVTSSKAES